MICVRGRLALIVGICLLVGGLAWGRPAFAAADPYAGLAAPNYQVMARAVRAIAVSGDPRAAVVIAALRDHHLFTWRYPRPGGGLFIQGADFTYRDARTGRPVSGLSFGMLRPVMVNDLVRAAIETALGILDLYSPDAGKRLAAAQAVFKAADPGALPAIDKALAREKTPAVRHALLQARAAARMNAPGVSIADRLEAIATIRARGDLTARGMLVSLSGQPPAVEAAAHAAVASIDRILALWQVLENIYYGISLGSVLLLAAAGLAITFGVMGVINMAHGELVMIGAYVTFVVQQIFRADAPGLFGSSLFVAVPAAFVVAGALGIVIERTLIRFLYGRPLETLLATWGLSLVLQQAVRSLFGATNKDVGTPAWMSGAVHVGGLLLTWNRIVIILFAFLVTGVLMVVLRYTPLGLRMRAVTQNRRMAAAMGIRTARIDALTFGLGCGIAGIAGVALSQIDNVSPNLGQNYIVDSFMVVVFGGVGNLWGTVLSALTLGVINKFLEPVAGAVLGKIAVLLLLIVFIQRRPRGLFPVKGRAVET